MAVPVAGTAQRPGFGAAGRPGGVALVVALWVPPRLSGVRSAEGFLVFGSYWMVLVLPSLLVELSGR